MGVLDKLKNALFEVEYVEVEEPPKKEKEKKPKEKKKFKPKTEKQNKPIAKKIVLPGRSEKVEELREEELKDEDFEIRPKNETIKDEKTDDFKFMDDNDFRMDEDDNYESESPKVLDIIDNSEVKEQLNEVEVQDEVFEDVMKDDYTSDIGGHPDDYYNEKPVVKHESKPYGMNNDYSIPVHQYGTYEKEDKSYFRPSPIISPIYGILDKNYKKEDVKEKKEIRLTGYSRSNVSVDDIRNKAYGRRINRVDVATNEDNDDNNEVRFDVEEEDNVLVDLSDKTKPEVKELTVGDALEYFQDLGLEYNVDYVDVSKEKNNSKKEEHKVETKVETEVWKAVIIDEKPKVDVVDKEPEKVVENEKVDHSDIDNDNLFDLIDSMYQEND